MKPTEADNSEPLAREFSALLHLTWEEAKDAQARGLHPSQYLTLKRNQPWKIQLYGPREHNMDLARDTLRDLLQDSNRLVEQATRFSRSCRDALQIIEAQRSQAKRMRVAIAEQDRAEQEKPETRSAKPRKPKKGGPRRK